MRRKSRSTADAATAREARQTNDPTQWRELLKVALLASAFVGAYATGAALSPVVPPTEPPSVTAAAAAPPPPPPPPPPEILPCPARLYITVVLPSVVNPPKRPQRLAAIAQTWGSKARAVFVVTKTSPYPPLPLPAPCRGYPYSLLVPSSIGEELGVERLRWVISWAEIIASAPTPSTRRRTASLVGSCAGPLPSASIKSFLRLHGQRPHGCHSRES